MTRAVASGHTTLVMDGVLDATTYRTVRDAVVKAALDAPPLILVDVTALWAPASSAWSVFTSARWLVVDWPDVPIGLVCSHVAGRRMLARNGITRYLPVYANLTAARNAMADDVDPHRRRVREVWPAVPSAVPSVRDFIAHWLHTWSLDEFAATAGVVATVLVDNVLRHTDSDPDVRLETDGATVTVAVTDGSPSPACVRDEDEILGCLSELQIVHALTRVWGNTPTPEGKVVWAVMGPENRL
ncbi:sulfate transporter [Mycolicibacterium sp. P1-18]|uniref:sulfate transporter n=1 Tax=Mycolicibacterium sp. P1-18 TaxID=2024615 RepID=UPI001F5BD195|nr:sulfate transporter [Mycolicibacterium sp. P1-18]